MWNFITTAFRFHRSQSEGPLHPSLIHVSVSESTEEEEEATHTVSYSTILFFTYPSCWGQRTTVACPERVKGHAQGPYSGRLTALGLNPATPVNNLSPDHRSPALSLYAHSFSISTSLFPPLLAV